MIATDDFVESEEAVSTPAYVTSFHGDFVEFFKSKSLRSRSKKSRYLEFGDSNSLPADVLLHYIRDQYSILKTAGIGIDEAVSAAATATLSCEGLLIMKRNIDMTEILLLVELKKIAYVSATGTELVIRLNNNNHYRFGCGLPRKTTLWRDAIMYRRRLFANVSIEQKSDPQYVAAIRHFKDYYLAPDFPDCSSYHSFVDEAIKNEERDFMEEGIVLLHEFHTTLRGDQEYSTVSEYRSYLDEYDKAEKKHLLLYNWIALSLVRGDRGDVAAVAVYALACKYRCFYTKNTLTTEDIDHARAFADMIRTAATMSLSIRDLRDNYGRLLVSNCFLKIERRVNELRRSLNEKINMGDGPKWKLAVDQVEECLLSRHAMASSSGEYPSIEGSADYEAIIQTGVVSLYEALHLHLISVKVKVSQLAAPGKLDADSFMSLSAQAWVLSRSKTMEMLAINGHIGRRLMLELSKVGEYFRGVSRLYTAISRPATRPLFQNLEIVPIEPPTQISQSLESNYLYVLEVIYYRHTGQALPIRRQDILKKFPAAIKNYGSFTKSFYRHAEITLLNYLESETKSTPTTIGVSKFCCQLCTAYIEAFNSSKYLLNKWVVSGAHPGVYLWQRDPTPGSRFAVAEKAVQALVYQEISRIVDSVLPGMTESPVNSQEVSYTDLLDIAQYKLESL